MSPAEQMLADLEELASLEAEMKKAAPTLAQKAIAEAPGFGSFVAKTGKDAARGLMSGMAGLLGSGGGKTGNIPLDLMSAATKGAGAQIQKALPIDPDETENEQLLRKTAEGMGGGALLGGGAGVIPSLFTGGVSGLFGELGRRFGDKAKMGPAGEIAGSALGGGLAGFMSGPRQSVAREDIRRALPEAVPQTFQNASQKLDDFASVGAKTHTLAEAFPENHPLRTLAEEARNGNSANALVSRTAERKSELKSLGDEFLNRIGPQVEPLNVQQRVAAAAENKLSSLEGLRSKDYSNTIVSAPPIRPDNVKMMEDFFKREAANPDNGRPKQAAFVALAKSLRGTDKQLITNVRLLVDQLKIAKEPVVKRGMQAADKTTLTKYNEAYREAVDALKAFSPAFEKAERQFKGASEGVIDPARASATGRLAGRDFDPGDPSGNLAVFNRLDTTMGIKNTLNDLKAGAPLDTKLPQDIARALSQQKLKKGSTNPGAVIRGEEGSMLQQNIAELLATAGKNPKEVFKPLVAADDLQGMQGLPGRNEGIQMRGWQALIRPFRTLDMMLSGQGQRSVQKELAELLADPAKLAELQKAAMFDPNLRRQLSTVGIMLPVLNQQGN